VVVLAVALALALVLAAALPPVGRVASAAELPLGPGSLDERRAGAQVAPGVRWTRIVREGGPWRVNVLRVAAGARVVVAPAARVVAPRAGGVGARVRPSELARRLRAVAAVNGGYFAGDGNPVGVLVSGGRLLSEPVDGRSALVLGGPDGRPARIASLRFAGAARVGGSRRLIDGVNRLPGEIPACGGRGGDRPTERPDAVTTCTDPSELVLFTPEWGRARRPAAGARAPTWWCGTAWCRRRAAAAAPRFPRPASCWPGPARSQACFGAPLSLGPRSSSISV